MPVSRLGVSRRQLEACRSGGDLRSELRALEAPAGPGQAFADLLLLAAVGVPERQAAVAREPMRPERISG